MITFYTLLTSLFCIEFSLFAQVIIYINKKSAPDPTSGVSGGPCWPIYFSDLYFLLVFFRLITLWYPSHFINVDESRDSADNDIEKKHFNEMADKMNNH
jgi:hypothetical protein